jgi:hypothetical protein
MEKHRKANKMPKAENFSGIICELGNLPKGAIVNEEALSKIFNRCQVSIKRAIQRCQLAPPITLLGMPVWTSEKLLSHLNARLDKALKESQIERKKFEDLEI